MQSKDFELEEEHLERPGYAVGNKRMLVRSRDNYLILMRPEVNTEKSRSKSKQIIIFRVQLFNIHTTNTVIRKNLFVLPSLARVTHVLPRHHRA